MTSSENCEKTSGELGRFEIWLPPISNNKLIRARERQRNVWLSVWRGEIAKHYALKEFAIPQSGPWPILIRITQLVCKGGRAFDDDNRAGMAKLVNDGLKRLGLIPDDSPKYLRTVFGDAEPWSKHPDRPMGGVRVEMFRSEGLTGETPVLPSAIVKCPHCGGGL